MKYLLIITLFAIPSISFAWSSPVLESICLGDKNGINITLGTESDYVIEFSSTATFDDTHEEDFIHSGSHSRHSPIEATTLYARYKSDHNAKTSVSVKDCAPNRSAMCVFPAQAGFTECGVTKEEKKNKSGRRKHKHGYVRRPVVAPLPLFDLPLFDYPSEAVIKLNLKD